MRSGSGYGVRQHGVWSRWARAAALAAALVSIAGGGQADAQQSAESDATCQGLVIHDLTADGILDADEPAHGSGAAATIEVLDSVGRRAGVLSEADGRWSVPLEMVFPIRAEIVPPTGFDVSPSGPDVGLSTQFITRASDCGQGRVAVFGVHRPADYCRAEPRLVTTCFVVGDAAGHDAAAAIISVAHDAVDNGTTEPATSSDWLEPDYVARATAGEVGSVHGLAVASDGYLYAAAFTKRHGRLASELNPSGNPTAVYRVAPSGAPELFTMVDSAASNPRADGPDSDYGQDLDIFDDVFRTGLGDLQLSADGSALYTVDLAARALIEIDVRSRRATRAVTLDGMALGVTDCDVSNGEPFGDLRPFGLGVDPAGMLLIGVVCSAESTVSSTDFPVDREPPGEPAGDPNKLWGYVFGYDGSNFQLLVDWPLAGDRGQAQSNGEISNDAAWHPWVDVYPFDGELETAAYPQPAITDIAVDANGDMVIAVGDRWGHQTGPNTSARAWDGELRDVVEPIVAGDLQRACRIESGWAIEGSSGCQGGLGDREFYTGDRYGVHDETALGSVAVIPGRNEVVATHFDPIQVDDTWRSGGFVWHDINTGSPRRGLRVYDGRSAEPETTFEKAAGLGGIAVDCGPPPLQLGSMVWYDQDNDGIRDVTEPGIGDVLVEMFDESGTRLARTWTDASGTYVFDQNNVGPAIVAGIGYTIALAQENFAPGGAFGVGGQSAGLRLVNVSGGVFGDNLGSYEPAGVRPELPSIQVVAGDDPATPPIESYVNHRLGFAMGDQYDLALASTLDRIDLETGAAVFEVTVQNQGSISASRIEITNTLPAGVAFVEASRRGREIEPGIVRWDLDEPPGLPAGAQVTLQVAVRLDDPAIELVNVAEITDDDGDDDDSTPASTAPDSITKDARDVTVLADLYIDRGATAMVEDDLDVTRVGLGEIGGTVVTTAQDVRAEDDLLASLMILLTGTSGAILESTQADEQGAYVFSYLLPGDYYVELVQPDWQTSDIAVEISSANSPPLQLESRSGDPMRSGIIELYGASPTGEALRSPTGAPDKLSDLTIDFAITPSGQSSRNRLAVALVVAVGAIAIVYAAIRIRRRKRK